MLRRFSTFTFAAILAAQCALPCFGSCAAATSQPQAEQKVEASVSACHGSPAAPASETVANTFVGNTHDAGASCCCLATPVVPPSGESPIAPAIRDTAPTAFTPHVGLESNQHNFVAGRVEHYRAALPPGPRLFIAYHSLLI